MEVFNINTENRPNLEMAKPAHLCARASITFYVQSTQSGICCFTDVILSLIVHTVILKLVSFTQLFCNLRQAEIESSQDFKQRVFLPLDKKLPTLQEILLAILM